MLSYYLPSHVCLVIIRMVLKKNEQQGKVGILATLLGGKGQVVQKISLSLCKSGGAGRDLENLGGDGGLTRAVILLAEHSRELLGVV